MNADTALRAVAAGAATGARTFTGLAALVLATPAGATRQPDRTLGTPRAKAATLALAGAELVGDKLPQAPSRLSPPALGGRIVTALGVGALVADRTSGTAATPGDGGRRRDVALCAGLAVTAALATSRLGNRARGIASARVGGDLPGAVAEDVVTVALAYCAARPAPVIDAMRRSRS